MENGITEVVFILDRSGSMSGLEADTIGGFNAMIEKQKMNGGYCYISTVLFNNESYVLHDRVPLQNVRPMTSADYQVGACTALLDAVGDSIRHISNIHKYARPEDVPENTLFVITTDGMENASHKYAADEVKKMVKEKQEQHGWEFLFLGADIDTVQSAANIGISAGHAVSYHSDSRGIQHCFHELSENPFDSIFKIFNEDNSTIKELIEKDFDRK